MKCSRPLSIGSGRVARKLHAETLICINRTCDSRADEMKAHHEAAIAAKDSVIAQLQDEVSAKQMTVAKLEVIFSERMDEAKARHAAAVAAKDTTIAQLQDEASAKEVTMAQLRRGAVLSAERRGRLTLTDLSGCESHKKVRIP
jgi:hypothetical protein